MKTKVDESNGLSETVVISVKVEKVCPKCGDGKMESCAGMVLTSYPAQYPHKCTKCDHYQHYSGVTFPYIKYK